MKKKEKSKLKFSTVEEDKKSKKKKIFIIFLIVALTVALASAVAVFKESGFNKDKNVEETEKTNMEKTVNILLGGNTSKDNLIFLDQVIVDTQNNNIKITPIMLQETVDGKALEKYWNPEEDETVSGESLMEVAGKLIGVKFDRYIILKEGSMDKLLYKLGKFNVDIDEKIDYEGPDYSIHWPKGKRELTGEDFFNYLRYVGESGTKTSQYNQANILNDFVKQNIMKEQEEHSQELFESIVNLVDSNISIQDYSRYASFIDSLSKGKVDISVLEK